MRDKVLLLRIRLLLCAKMYLIEPVTERGLKAFVLFYKIELILNSAI
jgi:hypothetical protein